MASCWPRCTRDWQALLASTAAAGSGALERFADVDDEELRQVLYAPSSPVAVEPARGAVASTCTTRRSTTKSSNGATPSTSTWRRRRTRRRGPTRWSSCPLPYEPRILVRGNPDSAGQDGAAAVSGRAQSGRAASRLRAAAARLELARAIVSRDNPLTARVIVNRVWAHHFGAGLVRTPSNFGLRGEAPTHPELLDYLAARFMDEGWSIKKLHRWIMLSSVYQQSRAAIGPNVAHAIPRIGCCGKMNRRRLDFEALRDSLLAAAGRLDPDAGRPERRPRCRPARESANGVRAGRSPGPAGHVADVRFRQSRRAQSRAATRPPCRSRRCF